MSSPLYQSTIIFKGNEKITNNYDYMEKKFKLIISPERCDAEALAHFIAELERLKLGVLTNGEIVYDDKNEKEVFNLMEKCILNKE